MTIKITAKTAIKQALESSTFEQQTRPEDNPNTNRKPTPTFSKNYIQQTRAKETTLH
jgi:hypothetical protein